MQKISKLLSHSSILQGSVYFEVINAVWRGLTYALDSLPSG